MLTLMILGILYGIIFVIHLRGLSYTNLYQYNVILIFIGCSLAGITLSLMLRKSVQFPTSHIEFAHLCWLTIFWLLASISLSLIALNAVLGLIHNEVVIETPLQQIGYLLNALAMACMMIVTGPDTLLYRSVYPYRLWQYHKLLRLKDFILQHIEIEPITIVTDITGSTGIEVMIHDTLVTILDYYPYILDYESFRLALEQIEGNTQDMETMLFKMTRLKLPLS